MSKEFSLKDLFLEVEKLLKKNLFCDALKIGKKLGNYTENGKLMFQI